MPITAKDIEKARLRREELTRSLGRGTASFRRLAEMTGWSVGTIHVVLHNTPTVLPVDREKILNAVNAAMDQIEANGKADDQGTVTADPIK